jgi:hypothetical protein
LRNLLLVELVEELARTVILLVIVSSSIIILIDYDVVIVVVNHLVLIPNTSTDEGNLRKIDWLLT